LLAEGVPILPAILIGLLIGGFCGSLAGSLVAWGRIPPFIATLGIMGVARGAALLVSGAVAVTGLPDQFNLIAQYRVFGVVPLPVVFVIVLAFIFHIVLTKTVFGRHIFAIGNNPDAAKLSGVEVAKRLFSLYIINGILCGFAGILLASRLSTGQPEAGRGIELDVIAACVIGGASLSGGEGTILGAMIGALIMGILRNGCNLLDISEFWQQIAIGSIIIIAVFADQYQKYKKERA